MRVESMVSTRGGWMVAGAIGAAVAIVVTAATYGVPLLLVNTLILGGLAGVGSLVERVAASRRALRAETAPRAVASAPVGELAEAA